MLFLACKQYSEGRGICQAFLILPIGCGKRAGPRPSARETDAADDQERADESVKQRAARRLAGVRVGELSRRDTYRREHPPFAALAAQKGGGSLPSLSSCLEP